jgi:hypothetical protein
MAKLRSLSMKESKDRRGVDLGSREGSEGLHFGHMFPAAAAIFIITASECVRYLTVFKYQKKGSSETEKVENMGEKKAVYCL